LDLVNGWEFAMLLT